MKLKSRPDNTIHHNVYAVIGLPLGRFTDNWIRTRLVAIGVTIWSLFTAASGIAWSHATFIASRIGVGTWVGLLLGALLKLALAFAMLALFTLALLVD